MNNPIVNIASAYNRQYRIKNWLMLIAYGNILNNLEFCIYVPPEIPYTRAYIAYNIPLYRNESTILYIIIIPHHTMGSNIRPRLLVLTSTNTPLSVSSVK